MNPIIRDAALSIRAMEENPEDFSLFLEWMSEPEVMQYWDGFSCRYTYEDVVQQYKKHLKEQVHPCLICLQDRPLGYCQFYITDASSYEVPASPWKDFFGERSPVFGLDLFLAHEAERNQGLGRKAVQLLTSYLFSSLNAQGVVIDPKVHNARAIACYLRCGFEKLFVVPRREEQDGVLHDSLIMGLLPKG